MRSMISNSQNQNKYCFGMWRRNENENCFVILTLARAAGKATFFTEFLSCNVQENIGFPCLNRFYTHSKNFVITHFMTREIGRHPYGHVRRKMCSAAFQGQSLSNNSVLGGYVWEQQSPSNRNNILNTNYGRKCFRWEVTDLETLRKLIFRLT